MIGCWVVAQGVGGVFLVGEGVQGFFLTDCLDVQELKINFRIKLSQAAGGGGEKQTTKSKVYNKILHLLLINFHMKLLMMLRAHCPHKTTLMYKNKGV